ncbi:NAD(P)H-dependent oxidoreductase, partial [Desulfovibrio sp. OttesenSCG-928-F07]|nr:NAD(P)H-dependent oxidoreductase [Desulfovibrio sp. OttesenSCG-928-F07]
MKMLYIQASPRLMRSHSKAIADAFVEAWKRFNPEAKVVTKTLFELELPEFNEEVATARFLAGAGKAMTPEQQSAWGQVKTLAEEFAGFDRYCIATPMWNFSLPYKLKHYLDLVIQPGITFNNQSDEYKNAVKNKKVALFLARGGQYPEGSPIDMQKPYLAHALKMMGLTNTHWVLVEPTV